MNFLRLAALLGIGLLVGCNFSSPQSQREVADSAVEPAKVGVETGMKMAAARNHFEGQGLKPQLMAISGNHYAYDLPNGKVVILVGDESLDSILLLHNPDQPKVQRVYDELDRFSL